MAILPTSQQKAPDDGRRRLLAERLRMLMADKGLTVTATARLLQERLPGKKFNSVNLSHYRAGRSVPRQRILIALSEILGVSPEELAPVNEGRATRGVPGEKQPPHELLKIDGEVDGPPERSEPRLIGGADHLPAPEQLNDLSFSSVPTFHLEDLDSGEAWLQINQRLSWPTVIKILQVLKGEK